MNPLILCLMELNQKNLSNLIYVFIILPTKTVMQKLLYASSTLNLPE